MIRLPVVHKGVTIQEIPGHLSVFFEIGNCNQRCNGCHSPHLTEPFDTIHSMSIAEMVRYAEQEATRGATAIVLMGGTTNGIPLNDLKETIARLSSILPVGIYSGLPVDSNETSFLKSIDELTWIKAGEYQEELGGLSSPTTNQKFYEKQNVLKFDNCGVYVGSIPMWTDMTYRFQQE